MKGVDVDRLAREARELGRLSEDLRRQQLAAARKRQEAILSLHAVGLSVRDIAKRLGSSPAVVQTALKVARARRPHIPRREERIPYELHVQLALKLRENEESVRELGRAGIERMRRKPRNPIAEQWIDRWESLLDASVEDMERAMLAADPLASEMRQMSPFAGSLSDEERIIAIRKAAANAP
ncbi:helix-turn-helix domain-containing protein [Arthrobacter sp. CJ23]|uniref:helix-turn-helix domain-containing protein n=1 Tax=Arthrobacter sp. CJ23 TaxID=2972479 RepID=UPI00215CECE1|nr:helix-turn-helix domain-containing protein [Arthrobacter sp. CJ23]UVJ40169.1 helix-turn-helix domain-containing protein [Arthrobacter sp. CJ23]